MMSSLSAELQRQVAQQSNHRCAYCQSQQRLMGVALTIDHIVPQSLGGSHELENLCLSCWDCNLIKSDRTIVIDPLTQKQVRLFHPNQQIWLEHFGWNDFGTHIIGHTAIGRATITALRLNRAQLLESRRYWVKAGWHPPKD
ncbi:MAG TPA: HNH endonuclease [Anaerolineae bacterium]|nr:HNH endonuclease [Anaerolineae bacterium]